MEGCSTLLPARRIYRKPTFKWHKTASNYVARLVAVDGEAAAASLGGSIKTGKCNPTTHAAAAAILSKIIVFFC